MIKRYIVDPSELRPVSLESIMSTPLRINTVVVKEDDIKDSLIDWHDLREDPEDLPEKKDMSPVLAELEGDINVPFVAVAACDIRYDHQGIIKWAYIPV